jgi:hypothetical protein
LFNGNRIRRIRVSSSIHGRKNHNDATPNATHQIPLKNQPRKNVATKNINAPSFRITPRRAVRNATAKTNNPMTISVSRMENPQIWQL